jgi:uncharacterized protein YigA (DUF484 family)
MTIKEQDSETSVLADVNERDIVKYLQDTPEFFLKHPELLTQLKVPHHESGDAVSLIERQVSVLRDDNRQLRHRIREMIEIAKDNDALMARLHALSVTLVKAESLGVFFRDLDDHLKRDFAADQVSVRLFVDKPSDEYPQLISAKAEGMELFDSILIRKKPVCGRFNEKQLAFLFGDKADLVGSTAVVPLVDKDSIGMFAVASADRERFRAGMSTVFLSFLAEVGGAVAKRFI